MHRTTVFNLERNGETRGQITGWYSEKSYGYTLGDLYLKPEMTMRLTTTECAQPGDILHTTQGQRYRVGAVERLGRRFVLELSREA